MDEIEQRLIEDRATWLDWRADDLTASIAACLYSDEIHPYTTAYQQWAFHSGLWKPKPIDRKLARRGAVIEKIAPGVIVEEEPTWELEPNGYYFRDPEERIGATPDLVAFRPDIEGRGNVQVKSVGAQAFRRWKDRDTGETQLPVWVAIQANIEAALMGATWAAVVAITIGDAGLDVEIIDVPIRADVMESFRLHAREFWRRVKEKDPYPHEWGKDAAIVLEIYSDDDGSTTDLSSNDRIIELVNIRERLKLREADGDAAAKERRLFDAAIISILGNAAKGRLADGRLVEAKTVKRKGYTVEPSSYRAVKVKP